MQELKKKLTETVARLPRTCVAIYTQWQPISSLMQGYYNIITTNGSQGCMDIELQEGGSA